MLGAGPALVPGGRAGARAALSLVLPVPSPRARRGPVNGSGPAARPERQRRRVTLARSGLLPRHLGLRGLARHRGASAESRCGVPQFSRAEREPPQLLAPSATCRIPLLFFRLFVAGRMDPLAADHRENRPWVPASRYHGNEVTRIESKCYWNYCTLKA